MSPADLDDVFERLGLRLKRVPEIPESGQQRVVNLDDCSHVHRRREPAKERSVSTSRRPWSDSSRVVAALAHVYMVVRMDGLLRSQLSAEDLNRTV